jgi:hypothetical protein
MVVYELKPYIGISNKIQPGSDIPVDNAVFGIDHPINWGFYFQKASLVAQFGNWEKVVDLWKELD